MMRAIHNLEQKIRPGFHGRVGHRYDRRSLRLLNALRFRTIECRAERHVEFFKACQLIQTESQIEVESHITALARILHQAIGQAPVIHAPGSRVYSFDEKWLLQIFEQYLQEDFESVLFLIQRRVVSYKQSSFAALMSRMVRANTDHHNS